MFCDLCSSDTSKQKKYYEKKETKNTTLPNAYCCRISCTQHQRLMLKHRFALRDIITIPNIE